MKKLQLLLLFIAMILIIVIAVHLLRPPLSMKNVWYEPHFHGTVVRIHDDYIIVQVRQGEEVREISEYIHVSRNVTLTDSTSRPGDRVAVYFDGNITPGDPPHADVVYAIIVTQPARLPRFGAVIEEVFDTSILVRVDNTTLTQESGVVARNLPERLRIPIDNIEWMDWDGEFFVDDWITVYFNGRLDRETEPPELESVHNIWLRLRQ